MSEKTVRGVPSATAPPSLPRRQLPHVLLTRSAVASRRACDRHRCGRRPDSARGTGSDARAGGVKLPLARRFRERATFDRRRHRALPPRVRRAHAPFCRADHDEHHRTAGPSDDDDDDDHHHHHDDEEDLDLDDEEEDVDDEEEDEDAAPTFNSLPPQPVDGPPLPPNPVQPSYPVPFRRFEILHIGFLMSQQWQFQSSVKSSL
jgi:hypothetical protein